MTSAVCFLHTTQHTNAVGSFLSTPRFILLNAPPSSAMLSLL
jgi:hypothetical protein